MPRELTEKFSWITPELSQVLDSGKHSVTIKGVALYGNAVSRNGRKYVDEELKKAARTWIRKPITVNHDPNKIVGHVIWMEYDSDNKLEYIAVVDKQPYVDMIRMYGRNPGESSIRGVSVEASFLHMECNKCGKAFYDATLYHQHMDKEHFLKTNPMQPFGLFGDALSLVEAPEEPGVMGTTIQVMETVQHDFNRLCETIVKFEEEKEKMSKIAVEKEQSIAVGKTGIIMNTRQETKPLSISEANNPTQTTQKEAVVTMLPSKEESSVKNYTATHTVKPIQKLDSTETAPKLKLGEPFADYTDFADCVAKNSDKENPEAYCGNIKHETEGETFFRKTTTEKLNEIIDAVNKSHELPVQEWLETVSKDDVSWKEQIANLPKDDITWKEPLAEVRESEKKANTLFFERIDALDKGLTEIKTTNEKQILALQEDIKKTAETHVKEIANIKEAHLKEIATLKETMEKRIVETEAKLKEYDSIKTAVEKADAKVLEMETKLKEQNEKEVQESAETKAIAEKALDVAERAKTESENNADKINKGKFKGAPPSELAKEKTPDLTWNP